MAKFIDNWTFDNSIRNWALMAIDTIKLIVGIDSNESRTDSWNCSEA